MCFYKSFIELYCLGSQTIKLLWILFVYVMTNAKGFLICVCVCIVTSKWFVCKRDRGLDHIFAVPHVLKGRPMVFSMEQQAPQKYILLFIIIGFSYRRKIYFVKLVKRNEFSFVNKEIILVDTPAYRSQYIGYVRTHFSKSNNLFK